MIKQLKNPMTDLYLQFKSYMLSNEFSWYYNSCNVSNVENPDESKYGIIPFYSHNFLNRPEQNKKYPTPNSPHLDTISTILKEIIDFNNIEFNTFFRINANSVHPELNKNLECTLPHYDHNFPHKNILIYLTDAGGKTIVEGESFNPKEDNVIVFCGKHYYHLPKEKRRIVCVATFI